MFSNVRKGVWTNSVTALLQGVAGVHSTTYDICAVSTAMFDLMVGNLTAGLWFTEHGL